MTSISSCCRIRNVRTVYLSCPLLECRKCLDVSCVRIDTGLSTWMLKWSSMRLSSSFLEETFLPESNFSYYWQCANTILQIQWKLFTSQCNSTCTSTHISTSIFMSTCTPACTLRLYLPYIYTYIYMYLTIAYMCTSTYAVETLKRTLMRPPCPVFLCKICPADNHENVKLPKEHVLREILCYYNTWSIFHHVCAMYTTSTDLAMYDYSVPVHIRLESIRPTIAQVHSHFSFAARKDSHVIWCFL